MKSSVMLLLLLVFCWDKCCSSDDDVDSRTESEWRRVWHTEHNRRCFRDLISHMEIVCRHDIYKIARRSQPPALITESEGDNSLSSLIPRGGHQLRPLRRVRRGITDECCSDRGCSWEEYAEYCPTNRRLRTHK